MRAWPGMMGRAANQIENINLFMNGRPSYVPVPPMFLNGRPSYVP